MDSIKDLIEKINEIRTDHRSPPLASNAKLTHAAELHAAYMLQHNVLSHVGRNGSAFDERIRKEGYALKTAAENVALGAITTKQVLSLWMNSPPHKANILNPLLTEIGVGTAPLLSQTPDANGRYWSMSVAAPFPPPAISAADAELSQTEISQAEQKPLNSPTVLDPF